MRVWLGLALGLAACGGALDGGDSEVATSVVSGALNNTSGSALGWIAPRERKTPWQKVLELLDPVGTAYAATWGCTGGTLAPHYTGPGAYTWTPLACTVQWGNNRMASSSWSTTFDIGYGTSCDRLHAWIGDQAAGCAVTRTTPAGGNTRTITGPNGGTYSVNHDTSGAGTGWDTTVMPAPSNGGVIATCSAQGCGSGGTLEISGSHLTGTVASPNGQTSSVTWDHTVSTTTPLALTITGTTKTVTGVVTVQHNLLKYTADTTFNDVQWGDGACCFPTSGSVTTTFSDGTNKGKSESLSFSGVCGEATFTNAKGKSYAFTLQHCL